jgi:hypothetical protein
MIPQGQVAAERGQEHGPNLHAVCRYDAERQGERKCHDQPEQDLRDPVHVWPMSAVSTRETDWVG